MCILKLDTTKYQIDNEWCHFFHFMNYLSLEVSDNAACSFKSWSRDSIRSKQQNIITICIFYSRKIYIFISKIWRNVYIKFKVSLVWHLARNLGLEGFARYLSLPSFCLCVLLIFRLWKMQRQMNRNFRVCGEKFRGGIRNTSNRVLDEP